MQTIQMLLESLANDWDSTAEALYDDNHTLRALLIQSANAIKALPQRNERLTMLAPEIENAFTEPSDDSLVLSVLAARNQQLRATLETVLIVLEDLADEAGYEALMPVRRQIYEHLREIAVRGWSFWDLSSFRERMARLTSESSKVTG